MSPPTSPAASAHPLPRRARSAIRWFAALALGCLAWSDASAAEPKVSFSRDVLPILSDNCFFCHGPDENHREADLRLDKQEGAHSVLTPGKPADSELLQRVLSDDEFVRMPPPESNKRLTSEQKQVLRQWITEGAPWGKHWAFEALQPPELPDVAADKAAPIQNWIDIYVQNALETQGRQPAPEASPRVLLRRVTLDLTGLPPTPEETAAFLADRRPGAYERLVDRLLASPAFGERMAWDWLDAARYADTNGYQGDRERTMWPWRDWVVDAYNRGLPFDQFTTWQLAGDLLPAATHEQRLATGFCRNHMINGEGGRIPEENRVDYVMDMTETMGSVWLGLTLNCCRCHDHKFDPLKQREYYQLFAFFNQTPVTGGGGDPQTPPNLAAPSPSQQRRLAALDEELRKQREQLESRRDQLSRTQAAWEREQVERAMPAVWQALEIANASAEHQTLKVLPDQSVLATGERVPNDAYTLEAAAPAGDAPVTAIRLEALLHDSLRASAKATPSLSKADSGNFVLTEFEVQTADSSALLEFGAAKATFQQGNFAPAGLHDGKSATGWAVHEGKLVDREHAGMLRFKQPQSWPAGAKLRIALRHDSPHAFHNLGRFRLSVTRAAEPALEAGPEWRRWLQIPRDDRTKKQEDAIIAAHHASDGEHRRLESRLQELEKRRQAVMNAVAKVMVMKDSEKSRSTFILDRGLYNQPQQEVSAEVPSLLPQLPTDAPPNRLALAKWLLDPKHPLTARVAVNRVWQQLFGVGLVKTSVDFGVQGERPLHPELLDKLAWEFLENGWELKRLMRTIVLSHTYRQSSRMDAEDVSWDPENRWLSRGPRYRLPSWMLRDQALAAAGLLARRQGGPSVKPYQPPGVWEEATFGKKKFTQDHGAALYRRSLYTFWRRIIAPTMFFDNASRQTCTVKTFRTNTPLHALLTLNDVTYVEAARVLAERALRKTAGSESRDRACLDAAAMRVLARKATDAEAAILLAAKAQTLERFREDPEAAKAWLAHGEYPRDEGLDVAEHAAWTAVCLSLLNLDETLTKE